MDDDEFVKRLKKEMAKNQEEVTGNMVSIAEKLDDVGFIELLETIAKIEPGPARILLKEAAGRLRGKIAN